MDIFHDKASFYDTPITPKQFYRNAPNARTNREATHYYIKTRGFLEPKPLLRSTETVISQITHPRSLGAFIDRQVALQADNTIRKSVRAGLSDLRAEKDALELVWENTSIPVPRVYDYYKSAEFEHLVMEKMPGITLKEAWPALEFHEKEKIADEVVGF